VRALLPDILVAFATCLLDDIFGLKPWMKVLGQVVAAALACHANIQIGNVAGYTIATWLQVPLTIVWLVGCSNAFNLIDGLDGLATGVGLFAAGTALLSALITGNSALAFVTAPLFGALLGFLPYNFNPASIFMGDCGSLTVGFLLGCFGVIWSQKSATLLGMTAPFVALAIPLLDTALAIARRFLRGQPLFGADRGISTTSPARGSPAPRGLCPLCLAGIVAGLFCSTPPQTASSASHWSLRGIARLAIQYPGTGTEPPVVRSSAGSFGGR
jgi:UDP-GlcNAc:undecaprenyl-phosphate GlcNAc-1-phosphate transferase